MPGKRQEPDSEAKPDEAEASEKDSSEDEPDEPKLSRERFLAESEALVGEPAHVVAGALDTLPASTKNFTVDEVEAAIKDFLKQESPTTATTTETPPEA